MLFNSATHHDLQLQLAAAIMDCVTAIEGKRWYRDRYLWADDRSEMYVDVARMARDASDSWIAHSISGIIYEVSEAIADKCAERMQALTTLEIDNIVRDLKGVSDDNA